MDDAIHCDRLIFVKDGHIIAEDSPQGLMDSTGKTNATLEDSFIYFNSRDKINDIN
jgi:ABC-2 type transport system ATP-binding protein